MWRTHAHGRSLAEAIAPALVYRQILTSTQLVFFAFYDAPVFLCRLLLSHLSSTSLSSTSYVRSFPCAETSSHSLTFRDVYDAAVRWRQISEPFDPVFYIDGLSRAAFEEGFGLQTPMVSGQNLVPRYYPQVGTCVRFSACVRAFLGLCVRARSCVCECVCARACRPHYHSVCDSDLTYRPCGMLPLMFSCLAVVSSRSQYDCGRAPTARHWRTCGTSLRPNTESMPISPCCA